MGDTIELGEIKNLEKMNEESPKQDSEFIEPTKEELQNVIDDIKIDLSLDEDTTPEIENEIEKPKEVKKVKSIKTDKSTDEIANDLFDEFSSFMETKAKIVSDTGIKQTIPTGINVLDTILGGGFVVGALNMIVGAPGSGKCLDYDEEIDIYVEE